MDVLIVDDEADFIDVCIRLLAREPYRIEGAQSGEQALAKLADKTYHVLVSDIRMPNMDGLALMQKVQWLYPETAIVAITAHGDIDLAVQCMKYGALDFLQKPVGSAKLRETLASAMQSRRTSDMLAENRDSLDHQVSTRVMEVFIEDTARVLDEMEIHIQRHEYGNVRELAHYLKSSCCTIYRMGMDMVELCVQLMHMDEYVTEQTWQLKRCNLLDLFQAVPQGK